MLTISTMLAVAIMIAIVFLALVLIANILIVGLKLGWAIGKTIMAVLCLTFLFVVIILIMGVIL